MTDPVPPEDDQSIGDAAELWRRLNPDWCIWDKNLGRKRPSSGAFDDSRDGTPMSVTIGGEASGPEILLENHEGYGLAVFPAGLARRCNQRLVRHPTVKDPAHVHVTGKNTDSVKNRLARESNLLVEPARCKGLPPEQNRNPTAQ